LKKRAAELRRLEGGIVEELQVFAELRRIVTKAVIGHQLHVTSPCGKKLPHP
jgi:hypothetical protein